MIGIVAPLPQEARAFGISARRGEVVCLPGLLLVVSGAGREAAERAAGRLVELGVSALIGFGTAAALAPHLPPGRLLLPERFLVEGEVLGAAIWPELRSRLNPLAPETGPLLSVEGVVAHREEKRRLFEESGAVALDMESGFLARWARERGLPFAAVRVVLDRADHSLPESLLLALDRKGEVAPGKLLKALLNFPSDLPRWLSLILAFRKAQKTMARAAKALLR